MCAAVASKNVCELMSQRFLYSIITSISYPRSYNMYVLFHKRKHSSRKSNKWMSMCVNTRFLDDDNDDGKMREKCH